MKLNNVFLSVNKFPELNSGVTEIHQPSYSKCWTTHAFCSNKAFKTWSFPWANKQEMTCS